MPKENRLSKCGQTWNQYADDQSKKDIFQRSRIETVGAGIHDTPSPKGIEIKQ